MPVGGGGGGRDERSEGTDKRVRSYSSAVDDQRSMKLPGAGGAPATRPAAIKVVRTAETFIVMVEL